MVQTARKITEHHHITREEGVCGGAPIVAGTRFSVRSVVTYILKQGWTPEELVQRFDHLTLAQVYDALAYYYDHQQEMESDIQQNQPSV